MKAASEMKGSLGTYKLKVQADRHKTRQEENLGASAIEAIGNRPPLVPTLTMTKQRKQDSKPANFNLSPVPKTYPNTIQVSVSKKTAHESQNGPDNNDSPREKMGSPRHKAFLNRATTKSHTQSLRKIQIQQIKEKQGEVSTSPRGLVITHPFNVTPGNMPARQIRMTLGDQERFRRDMSTGNLVKNQPFIGPSQLTHTLIQKSQSQSRLKPAQIITQAKEELLQSSQIQARMFQKGSKMANFGGSNSLSLLSLLQEQKSTQKNQKNQRKSVPGSLKSLFIEKEQTNEDLAVNQAVQSRFTFKPKGQNTIKSHQQSLFEDPQISQQNSLTLGVETGAVASTEVNHQQSRFSCYETNQDGNGPSASLIHESIQNPKTDYKIKMVPPSTTLEEELKKSKKRQNHQSSQLSNYINRQVLLKKNKAPQIHSKQLKTGAFQPQTSQLQMSDQEESIKFERKTNGSTILRPCPSQKVLNPLQTKDPYRINYSVSLGPQKFLTQKDLDESLNNDHRNISAEKHKANKLIYQNQYTKDFEGKSQDQNKDQEENQHKYLSAQDEQQNAQKSQEKTQSVPRSSTNSARRQRSILFQKKEQNLKTANKFGNQAIEQVVKLMPIEKRRLFSRVMKEVESLHLDEQDTCNVKIIRPKIRQILKKLKEDFEGDLEARRAKELEEQLAQSKEKELMAHKLQRKLFGMLWSEKLELKKKEQKNGQLREHFVTILDNKKLESKKRQERMDSRVQQLEQYGYISESESDSQQLVSSSSQRNRETTAEDKTTSEERQQKQNLTSFRVISNSDFADQLNSELSAREQKALLRTPKNTTNLASKSTKKTVALGVIVGSDIESDTDCVKFESPDAPENILKMKDPQMASRMAEDYVMHEADKLTSELLNLIECVQPDQQSYTQDEKQVMQQQKGSETLNKEIVSEFYQRYRKIDKIIENQLSLENYAESKSPKRDTQNLKIGTKNQKSPKRNTISSFMAPKTTKASKSLKKADLFEQIKQNQGFMAPKKQLPGNNKEAQIFEDIISVSKSPVTEYLKQVHKDKLLPRFQPFKNIQQAERKQNESGYDSRKNFNYVLTKFSLSERVAPAIALGIKNIANLQNLTLSDTMISDKSFKIIANSIPKSLQCIDLSQNQQLTLQSYFYLHKFPKLQSLSLENCGITDEIVENLFELDPLNFSNSLIQKNYGNVQQKNDKLSGPIKISKDEIQDIDSCSGMITTLCFLNLSRNTIRDKGSLVLSKFIKNSQRLQTLLLHWNQIRAHGSIGLSRAIRLSKSLQIIDFSFNSFARGSSKKFALRDTDDHDIGVEWKHLITRFDCVESAWKWRNTLRKNTSLIHVDLSHNGFVAEDMQAIGDGLRENQNILGFHCVGNNAMIDPLGFMIPQIAFSRARDALKKQKEITDIHNYARIQAPMDPVERATIIPVPRKDEQKKVEQIGNGVQDKQKFGNQIGAGSGSIVLKEDKVKDVPVNCWLCEGWSQMRFKVKVPEKFALVDIPAVNLHLSFENYRPTVMIKQQDSDDVNAENSVQKDKNQLGNSGKRSQQISHGNDQHAQTSQKQQVFYLNRMVPPTQTGIKYFFSLQNPKNFRKESFIDLDKQRVFAEEFQNRQKQGSISDDSEDEEIDPSINIPKFMNKSTPIMPQNFGLSHKDLISLRARPRQLFVEETQEAAKIAWTVEKSIFGNYKADNEKIIADCFKFDWDCSSIVKMVKSESLRQEIFEYLKPHYKHIREAYKHISAFAPSGNVTSIGMNIFTELILKCEGLVDYKTTKLSDVDLIFVAVNAQGAKQFNPKDDYINNPERQMIRYQFFESILRLALDKYQKTSPKLGPVESIKTFYQTFLESNLQKYESNSWRLERFWNQECENVIKENLQTLKDIYQFFGESLRPGQPKILKMNRFIDLVSISGVCDQDFGSREIGIIFNLSMQTSVDEINSSKHLNMKFSEFVEAFARVADKTMRENTQDFLQKDQESKTNEQESATKSPNKTNLMRDTGKSSVFGEVAKNVQLLSDSRESRTPIKPKNSSTSVIAAQPNSDNKKISQFLNVSFLGQEEAIQNSQRSSKAKIQQSDRNNQQNQQPLTPQTIPEQSDNSKFMGRLKDAFGKKIIEGRWLVGEQQNSSRVSQQKYRSPISSRTPPSQSRQNQGSKTPTKSPLSVISGRNQIQNIAGGRSSTTINNNLNTPHMSSHRTTTTPRLNSSRNSSNGGGGSRKGSKNQSNLDLSAKMVKYVRRVASSCLGPVYGHRFIRDQAKMTLIKKQQALDAAELGTQRDMAQFECHGLPSTLEKVLPKKVAAGNTGKGKKSLRKIQTKQNSKMIGNKQAGFQNLDLI